jgi:hypothetical protein
MRQEVATLKTFPVFFLLLLSVCVNSRQTVSPHPEGETWVQPLGFGPSTRSRLASTKYAQVKDEELVTALDRLASTQFITLSKEQLRKDFTLTGSQLPASERYYLVRALLNEGRGPYSAYFKSGGLLLLQT